MSKNCNYVYVQGLRFDPKHVKVLWRDADGVEHLVNLRKTGTGKAVFDEFGIPVTLTPKDLKKLIRDGETITVTVRLGHYPGDPDESRVRLELDPRKAEGRKGRKAFDPAAFSGLPPSTLRALALEQLKTAPYGAENRNQAVARTLWSLEHLDDAAIAGMLQIERIRYYDASDYVRDHTPSSAEMLQIAQQRLRTHYAVVLASLLLSDRVLIAALMAKGKHESLSGLLQVAPVATSMLSSSVSAEAVFAEIAIGFAGPDPFAWGDPAAISAIRYVTHLGVLRDLVDNREASVEALKRFVEVAPQEETKELLRHIMRDDTGDKSTLQVEAVTNYINDSGELERILQHFGRDRSGERRLRDALDLRPEEAWNSPKTAGDLIVFAAALERLDSIGKSRLPKSGDRVFALSPGDVGYSAPYAGEVPSEEWYVSKIVDELFYKEKPIVVKGETTYVYDLLHRQELPSDKVIEYLLVRAPHMRGGRMFIASRVQDPVVILSIANNPALAVGVRAAAVANIANYRDRVGFLDPTHPSLVRCAAIGGWNARSSFRATFYNETEQAADVCHINQYDPHGRRRTRTPGPPSWYWGSTTDDSSNPPHLRRIKKRTGTNDEPVTLRQQDLIRYANDPDPAVRRAVAAELLEVSTLVEMITSDKDAAVHAAGSLSAMVTEPVDRDEEPGRHTLLPVLMKAVSTALVEVDHGEMSRIELVNWATAPIDHLLASDYTYDLHTEIVPVIAAVARSASYAPEIREKAIEAMVRCTTSIGPRDTTVESMFQEIVATDAVPACRAAAVGGLYDQKVISDFLETEPNEHVRSHLVREVVSMEVVARVAKHDVHPLARLAAIKQARKLESSEGSATIAAALPFRAAIQSIYLAALEDSSPDVRKAVFETMYANNPARVVVEEAVCRTVAQTDPDPDVRRAAIKCLADTDALAGIATHDPDLDVRRAAIMCLTDTDALAGIATHDADPETREYARQRYLKVQEPAAKKTTDRGS